MKKQLLFQVFEEDLKFIAKDHLKKTAMDRGEKAFFIGVDKQNLIFSFIGKWVWIFAITASVVPSIVQVAWWTTALTDFIEDWKYCLDAKSSVGVVSLDHRNAFDSLPLDLSSAKLAACGLTSTGIILIKRFLHQRIQCVKISDTSYDWSAVLRGMPQESVLGLLLFNIVANDFNVVINIQISTYADANQLNFSHDFPTAIDGDYYQRYFTRIIGMVYIFFCTFTRVNLFGLLYAIA